MTQHIVGGVPQVLDAESFSRLFNVSRETMKHLLTYEQMLCKWQESINLVSTATLPDLWKRHFLDSAQLVALAPEDARLWVDLGCGGGFPGLVIAILLADRPGFHMHLVESDQRKCVFLREVARLTSAPVTVHARRIEQFTASNPFGDKGRVADVVSARALASLDKLLDWSAPLFGPSTIGLFLKGQRLPDELTLARKNWIFEEEIFPSRSDEAGAILKLRGLHGSAR